MATSPVVGYWFDKPSGSPYRWPLFKLRCAIVKKAPWAHDIVWGDWSLAWLIRDTARKWGVWHGY